MACNCKNCNNYSLKQVLTFALRAHEGFVNIKKYEQKQKTYGGKILHERSKNANVRIFINMKQEWSAQWKASVQPRKQRKYRANAPLHMKRTFMHAHLAKDLRKKYGRRQISLRKDDKVKIMNGDFKGKEGKVVEIDMKSSRIFIEGIDRVKKDGSKARIPLQVSNIMITALGKEDRRIKKQEGKKKAEKAKGKDNKPAEEIA